MQVGRTIVLAAALSAQAGLLHAQFDFKRAEKKFLRVERVPLNQFLPAILKQVCRLVA